MADPNASPDETVPGMSVPKLQHLCKKYKLSSTGSKAVLIERLEKCKYSGFDENHSMKVRQWVDEDGKPNHPDYDQITAQALRKNRPEVTIQCVTEPGVKVGFVYSIGFTVIGGREILIRNIHSSLFNSAASVIDSLFTDQLNGDPLLDGQNAMSRNIMFQAKYPDLCETAELQASVLCLASTVFGPDNYEVVELFPIFASKGTSKQKECEKFEDRWAQPTFWGKIHACDHYGCGNLSTMEGITLKNCARCKTVCYCSTKCQKKSWKQHKETCTFLQKQMKKATKDEIKKNQGEEKATRKKIKQEQKKHVHRLKKSLRDKDMKKCWENMTEIPPAGKIAFGPEKVNDLVEFDAYPRKLAELCAPNGFIDQIHHETQDGVTIVARVSEEFEREYAKTYTQQNLKHPDWSPYSFIQPMPGMVSEAHSDICGAAETTEHFLRHKNGNPLDDSPNNLIWMI